MMCIQCLQKGQTRLYVQSKQTANLLIQFLTNLNTILTQILLHVVLIRRLEQLIKLQQRSLAISRKVAAGFQLYQANSEIMGDRHFIKTNW